MLIEESLRRQEELKKHLYEMSHSCMSEIEIRKIAISFKNLYSLGFRHNYSSFFPLIVQIAEEEEQGCGVSLEYLSNNLEALRALVEQAYIEGEKEFNDLYRPLSKLSDHINLEIGRYSHYLTSEKKVADIEKKTKMITEGLQEATDSLDNAQKTVSAVQTDLIAVLSIFAAIVLSFSGSLSLLGSAFSAIATVSACKLALLVLLSGFILCNSIFLLLYVVAKITGRNIYSRCKSKDCSCGENGSPKCCGLTRVRKRLPYIFWLNVVFISLIFIDVLVWYSDLLWNIIP